MSTGQHVVDLLRKTLETLQQNEMAARCGEWATEKRPQFEDKQMTLPLEKDHGDPISQ